jgi:hypothetical protein
VARTFETSQRYEVLTWYHHLVAAPVEDHDKRAIASARADVALARRIDDNSIHVVISFLRPSRLGRSQANQAACKRPAFALRTHGGL